MDVKVNDKISYKVEEIGNETNVYIYENEYKRASFGNYQNILLKITASAEHIIASWASIKENRYIGRRYNIGTNKYNIETIVTQLIMLLNDDIQR